jgi:hypothetical protein
MKTKIRISNQIIKRYIRQRNSGITKARRYNSAAIITRFFRSIKTRRSADDFISSYRDLKTVNDTSLYEKEKAEVPAEFIANYRQNGKYYFFDIRELYLYHIIKFHHISVDKIYNPYTNTVFSEYISKMIYKRLLDVGRNASDYLAEMMADLSPEQHLLLETVNIFEIIKEKSGYYLDVSHFLKMTKYELFNFYERILALPNLFVPMDIHNDIITAYYGVSRDKLAGELLKLFRYFVELDDHNSFVIAEIYTELTTETDNLLIFFNRMDNDMIELIYVYTTEEMMPSL